MTIGILASRYAKALYGYASDTGQELTVYNEMKDISYQLLSIPELRRYLHNPILKTEKKIKLLATAAGKDTLSPCGKRFIEFIIERDKLEYLLYISTAYLNVYRKAKHIVLAQLVSAHEMDELTLEQVKKIILSDYNSDAKIELETRVNPGIIGGFKLTVEDKQLDASVSGQLKKLRKLIVN